MIIYRPTDGDVHDKPIIIRPRSCFIMTQLGGTISLDIIEIRNVIERVLKKCDYRIIDANSKTTGKDFLLKIWQLSMSAPIGIAIIDGNMSSQTMANIFYEIGWMQSLGKETIIVKTPDVKIPSDFVRTEYIEYNDSFEEQLTKYFDEIIEIASYYAILAKQVENNELLAIDYYRRAYLITKEDTYLNAIRTLMTNWNVDKRSKKNIEFLHCAFAFNDKLIG